MSRDSNVCDAAFAGDLSFCLSSTVSAQIVSASVVANGLAHGRMPLPPLEYVATVKFEGFE